MKLSAVPLKPRAVPFKSRTRTIDPSDHPIHPIQPIQPIQVAGRGRGEDGFAGGFAGLLFGLLLFVAGTLLVAFAWAVVDTKSATADAARQAARTYVEADSAVSAETSAEQAADAALAGFGRDPARARVQVTGDGFARCDRVTISVSYPAPLFDLPFVGSVGRGSAVTSQHSELVDPLRSGLPGVATCT